MSSRRGFIKSGALAAFGLTLGPVPGWIARAATANKMLAPYKKPKTLVCIFQRGAMDGLMAVSPFNDPHFKAARPGLYMPATRGGRTTPVIDLEGRFGLHPGLKDFQHLYKAGQLAILHGVGSPNNTRSHFDAQDYMESGTPFQKNTMSGWLNRASGLLGKSQSPFRAVSLTNSVPRSFYGYEPTISVSELQDFKLRTKGNQEVSNVTAQSFEELYDAAAGGLIKATGKETFEAVKMLEKIDTKNYQPANGAAYPQSPLGNALKQIAQLVKLDVGLEIGFAESGGWDTHYNQGTETGSFGRNMSDLSTSITAFWSDLASFQDDVTVMTMTEFGRTVKQNGSGGTDHGRASCSFILGNDVIGGLVYGDVKELHKDNLEDGRDLAVTTDFRAMFSEVAMSHLKLSDKQALFPGWTGDALRMMRS